MKTLLKLEEAALFLGGRYLFSLLPYEWWWFLVLILVPDIGMIGYVINAKVGAFSYNFLHNRIIAVAAILAGWYFNIELISLAGVIVFSHIAMDRMLGYGLKLQEGFKHTHLGKLT